MAETGETTGELEKTMAEIRLLNLAMREDNALRLDNLTAVATEARDIARAIYQNIAAERQPIEASDPARLVVDATSNLFRAYARLKEGAVIIDHTQNIIYANPSALRLFGYEQLVGLPLDTLIPERFKDVHREHVQGFDGEARYMNNRRDIYGQTASGAELWLQVTISSPLPGIMLAVIREVDHE